MADKIKIPPLSKKRHTMADVPSDSLVAALVHQELIQADPAPANVAPAEQALTKEDRRLRKKTGL